MPLSLIKQAILSNKNRFKRGCIIPFIQRNEEHIGAYSVGNFFKGMYVGSSGEMFNGQSMCVEINGLSCPSLLKLAEMIAKSFTQETALVKDLNRNKIYLAHSLEPDEDLNQERERP